MTTADWAPRPKAPDGRAPDARVARAVRAPILSPNSKRNQASSLHREVSLAPLLALDRLLDAPAATGELALRACLRAR